MAVIIQVKDNEQDMLRKKKERAVARAAVRALKQDVKIATLRDKARAVKVNVKKNEEKSRRKEEKNRRKEEKSRRKEEKKRGPVKGQGMIAEPNDDKDAKPPLVANVPTAGRLFSFPFIFIVLLVFLVLLAKVAGITSWAPGLIVAIVLTALIWATVTKRAISYVSENTALLFTCILCAVLLTSCEITRARQYEFTAMTAWTVFTSSLSTALIMSTAVVSVLIVVDKFDVLVPGVASPARKVVYYYLAVVVFNFFLTAFFYDSKNPDDDASRSLTNALRGTSDGVRWWCLKSYNEPDMNIARSFSEALGKQMAIRFPSAEDSKHNVIWKSVGLLMENVVNANDPSGGVATASFRALQGNSFAVLLGLGVPFFKDHLPLLGFSIAAITALYSIWPSFVRNTMYSISGFEMASSSFEFHNANLSAKLAQISQWQQSIRADATLPDTKDPTGLPIESLQPAPLEPEPGTGGLIPWEGGALVPGAWIPGKGLLGSLGLLNKDGALVVPSVTQTPAVFAIAIQNLVSNAPVDLMIKVCGITGGCSTVPIRRESALVVLFSQLRLVCDEGGFDALMDYLKGNGKKVEEILVRSANFCTATKDPMLGCRIVAGNRRRELDRLGLSRDNTVLQDVYNLVLAETGTLTYAFVLGLPGLNVAAAIVGAAYTLKIAAKYLNNDEVNNTTLLASTRRAEDWLDTAPVMKSERVDGRWVSVPFTTSEERDVYNDCNKSAKKRLDDFFTYENVIKQLQLFDLAGFRTTEIVDRHEKQKKRGDLGSTGRKYLVGLANKEGDWQFEADPSVQSTLRSTPWALECDGRGAYCKSLSGEPWLVTKERVKGGPAASFCNQGPCRGYKEEGGGSVEMGDEFDTFSDQLEPDDGLPGEDSETWCLIGKPVLDGPCPLAPAK